MPKIRIFTDIDDTLLATGRKIPESQRQQVSAYNADGHPSSYSTEAHLALWRSLQGSTQEPIVAVTARSIQALHRVGFSFDTQAVVDFGATVLDVDGKPDEAWYNILRACKSLSLEAHLLEMCADIAAIPLGVRVDVRRTAANLAFVTYRLPVELRTELRSVIFQKLNSYYILDQVLIHETDRDITILPSYINKGAAVAYLLVKNGWESDIKIGCADSFSDVSFLQHMSFSVLPRESRAMAGLIQQSASMKAI